jgi:TatD DNase family protein
MIDVHCHLEQKDYDTDRDKVIESCRKELKAVISSCAHLLTRKDYELGLEMHQKYRDFVFLSMGVHPIYIKKATPEKIEKAISLVESYRRDIVAIGEVGLDYYWVKDSDLRVKQHELFRRFIGLAKKLELPLVVHCREAIEETLNILEENAAGMKVMMHLYSYRKHLQRVLDKGYSISIGPSISTSKDLKKIARDMPLERIMLETDSPWFGGKIRNTPLSIKIVAQEIAEIKKIPFEQVWKQTALNAINFFNLPIKI